MGNRLRRRGELRASPGLAWCAAGRAANSRWSTLTKTPSRNPRAGTHSSSHDRLGWLVGDSRGQHLRMTSRISPTSGLAADVAMVDALRVVVPVGVASASLGRSRGGSRDRSGTGADQGSVATRRRQWRQDIGVSCCCLLIEDCLEARARVRARARRGGRDRRDGCGCGWKRVVRRRGKNGAGRRLR